MKHMEADLARATEHIPVFVTAREKARIARMAKAAGVSTGEFLRRAVASFPAEDQEILERMLEQMTKTAAQASAAVDDALAFIEASNRRIIANEARGSTPD